ncbi:hypothetical protein D3C72_2310690 [compost metagenome]
MLVQRLLQMLDRLAARRVDVQEYRHLILGRKVVDFGEITVIRVLRLPWQSGHGFRIRRSGRHFSNVQITFLQFVLNDGHALILIDRKSCKGGV